MAEWYPTTAGLRKREAEMLGNPDIIDTICEHLAEGGSVLDLAKMWDIRFGAIMNWLNKDDVRSKRYREACNARGEWAIERYLKELRLIGLADVRDLFDKDGKLLKPDQWPEDIARTIASYENTDDGAKVKTYDKLKALELLGKNMLMFADRVIETKILTLEDLVKGSYTIDVTPKEAVNGPNQAPSLQAPNAEPPPTTKASSNEATAARARAGKRKAVANKEDQGPVQKE